jgi:hypothetical protein
MTFHLTAHGSNWPKSDLRCMSSPRPDRTCQRAGGDDRWRYDVLTDSLLGQTDSFLLLGHTRPVAPHAA